MKTWQMVPLEDLASDEPNSVVDGPFGSDLKTSEYVETGLPLIRIQNIKPNRFLSKEIRYVSDQKARQLRRHNYRPGDLVITKLGDPCGVACIVPEEAGSGIIVADIVRFRGNPHRIHHGFLSHFINSSTAIGWIDREAKGTTRQRVNLSNFKRLPVPVPPLTEQQRLAEILDRAEALRDKRRAALAQLDTLTQAVFLDLFGDPAIDTTDWPEPEIASLAANKPNAIRTGPFGSQLLHSEFVDSGIAVLGIDNAVQNKFVWARPRFINEKKYRQLQRYKVFPGDVLITIMGTCGRCAVVPEKIPTAINTKHLCCISLDQSCCLPLYLQACFLQHPKVQQRLGIKERGAVMPGLNMQIIKELRIPLPPLDLQREFARRVTAVEKLKAAYRASLVEMDAFFASLQHRAFRGEL
jgi:type I restriction enzyme, S subunit